MISKNDRQREFKMKIYNLQMKKITEEIIKLLIKDKCIIDIYN